MNTDERRALKLLRDQGKTIDETEFRKWCNERDLRVNGVHAIAIAFVVWKGD